MSFESIQEMFSRVAARCGTRSAIERAGRRVTYAELETESNRLANLLLDADVRKGSMVSLLADDPARIITGILGCLKAGVVFVPLDPTFPDARLRAMTEQVHSDFYVVERKHLNKLAHIRAGASSPARVICLDMWADGTQAEGDKFEGRELELLEGYGRSQRTERPSVASDPNAPCSVYFTSGSTGKPKAILGRLKGIDHFMRWEIEAVGAVAGTRVSQLASPSFDGFLKDAFVPLCVGGVVCVPENRDLILDAEGLSDWLDVVQVEVLHCVPSVFRAIIKQGLSGQYFEAMRYVVLTGEPLYPSDVKRWMDVFGDRIKLLNIYGTTETTLSKFAYEVRPEDVERPSIPVGKPIKGAAMMVINQYGQPCGVGEAGEIYIRTPYRSFGYYNQPELTKEVFIQNPFSDDPSDIVHKTGDYGRLLKGGELEILGRRDQQVKVRGVRVELGEIENLLRGHEAVADVAIVDRDDAEGNKFLVAYVTMANGTGSGVLREYLSQQLPETMLPSAFVELEQLPRTLNGKIDRKALPTWELAQAERDAEELIPRGPIEEIVAGIWCEVLRLPAVGRTDSFFNLGGHSLLATQVILRVRETLKVNLLVRSVFEAPTFEQFTQLIKEQISEGRQSVQTIIEPVPRDGTLPLSFSQQRMWFLEQFGGASTAFHIPLSVRLKGPLNQAALEQTLGEIIRRHDNLRTSFPFTNGEPSQAIHPPRRFTLPLADLGGLDEAEQEAETRKLAEEQFTRPFELGTGPLVRLILIRYSVREHALVCTVHHIVGDGWSTGVIVKEISALYGAFRKGEPSPLPTLPVQYADFAAWQRQWLQGEVLQQELAYWKQNLAGAPTLLSIPTDRARPPVQTYNGAVEPFRLSQRLSEGLKELRRRAGVTLFMTLLAAFQSLLHRYTSEDDIVVGTSVASRDRFEIEGLIGCFVNMLALRTDCSGNPRFIELLAQVRETTLQAYAHQGLPFEKLVEELQPERNPAYPPIFQVMLSLQNAPVSDLVISELTLTISPVEVTTSKYDLLLNMWEDAEGLAGVLEYNSDLFNPPTAARLVRHFVSLLEGAVSHPYRRLSELPLMSEEERREVLVEWNATQAEYPKDRCIHELFERQAASTPDADAVVLKEERLTYEELNRRANRLARYLRAQGVRAGDVVGVWLEHSLEEVISIMGVLKAGAGYLPLEPTYPPPRLSFMLADAGASLVLTQQSYAGAVQACGVRPVRLDADWSLIERESATNLDSGVTPEHVAYIIYTSGSTGEPKGVVVPHRALVNYLWWAKDAYLQGQPLAFPLYSSLSFDLTATSLFTPLLTGNPLIVYPQKGSESPLLEIFRENRVGVLKLTPTHLALIKGEEHRRSRIRRLVVGGEALTTALAREVSESFGGRVEIFNEYGPTEATVGCMLYRFDPEADQQVFVPIGRPAANARIYVLNRWLEPVAEGVVGEVYIGGEGLAQGYLRRVRQTAERFVPDPFSGLPGVRMYRTGDLARLLAEGELEFLGRADEQVKIRGFRVEPGEVEVALGELPDVSQALVVAREGRAGGKVLVGYVVAAPGRGVEADGLRRQLAQRLPSYLVPAAITVLDALPLTPSGKVNRLALPEPEFSPAAWRAARTPQEEMLCTLFAEVLGQERVGIDDNFFESGGHSLLATRLASQVRATLGVELPISMLFESPSVAQLGPRLGEASRGRAPLLKQARPARLPLSYAQQRLWFLDRLGGSSTEYNLLSALRLRGELDLPALKHTLDTIVARHESLRTHFAEVDGEPVQAFASELCLDLPLEDLSALNVAEQEARVQAELSREAGQPFDLARGPLLRVKLLKLAERESILLRTMHHIVSDGWSEEVFTRELALLYEAARAGRPNPLQPLAVQYADFTLWQRRWLEAEGLVRGLDYWKRQLAGIPERLELPTDRPRPPVQSFAAALVQVKLNAAQVTDLKRLSQNHRVTLYMTLLAAFSVLLSRYSGEDEVVVGSPVANRQEMPLEELIGFFVNTLCLRVRVRAKQSFGELLGTVRGTVLGAYEHQEVPFERVVEELGPRRSLNTTPLFQVVLALQNAPRARERVEGLVVETVGGGELRVRYDIEVHVREEAGELEMSWVYNRDLFDGWRIEQMARHYLHLLEAVVSDPDQEIGRIDLLKEQEREQILEGWNDTAREIPQATLPELFEEQVSRTPEAVALVYATQHLSYGELNDRANRLAHLLIARGIGPEDVVAVALPRSTEMVVALLGILKAGAAYLPIDTEYPSERVAFMIADAGSACVITTDETVAYLPDGLRLFILDDLETARTLAESASHDPRDRERIKALSPLNPAYVIYTSGSTGRPKGVVNTHQGICNRLLWMQEAYQLSSTDSVLQKTPFSFDVSVWEFFWPLLTGARLVLALPGGHRDTSYLIETIIKEKITTAHFVPSMLQAFLETPRVEDCLSLRRVISSGEALTFELQGRFHARLGASLHNLYGPTEAAVEVTHWSCERQGARRIVPIGRPIANVQIYLLDPGLQPVPPGVVGELYIGGRGLARGYFNRPALTAENFIPHPFSRERGARLYRTGDLARFLPDGVIEYLGRADGQVKVRGFRIELGEIEAALVGHRAVREAVVTVREDDSGDKRLVAYVVCNQDAMPSVSEFRKLLNGQLPDYMIPSAFVALDALPLTPSGKVNRLALPEPEFSPAAWRAARTPQEEMLCTLFAEVLGQERVGIDDNFFESGGHSLLATHVILRVRDALKVELPIRSLFEAPTIAQFSQLIEEQLGTGRQSEFTAIERVSREGELPLSFAQERMWFLEQLADESASFQIPLGVRLTGRLNVAVLEQTFGEIIRRHEGLRTVFPAVGGRPVQLIRPPTRLRLPVIDLAGLTAAERERQAARLAQEETLRRFDLAEGPLVRLVLLRLGEEEHVLLCTMHHIIGDGQSFEVMIAEMSRLYSAFQAGETSPLEELSVQYADFAAWQRQWLQGEVLETRLGYWRRQLEAAPHRLSLPHQTSRPKVQRFNGARHFIRMSTEQTEALRELSTREGLTLFMTMLSAYVVLLNQYTGDEDIVVGSSYANRERAEAEKLIGILGNTLVLRVDLAGAATFKEVMRRVREVCLDAYTYQVPPELLREDLRKRGGEERERLFDVWFQMEKERKEKFDMKGLEVTPYVEGKEVTRFELSMGLSEREEEIIGVLEYDRDLFTAKTTAQMLENYFTLLALMAADPERALLTVSLTSKEEIQRLSSGFVADLEV